MSSNSLSTRNNSSAAILSTEYSSLTKATSKSFTSLGKSSLPIDRAIKKNAIPIRQSPFGAAGRVGKKEDDPKYYRFTLRRNTNQVQVGVKNLEAGGLFAPFTPTLQFFLERPNGKIVASRTVEGGEVEGINNLPLTRGNYFIRVTSTKGESVPYNIGLQAGAGLLS